MKGTLQVLHASPGRIRLKPLCPETKRLVTRYLLNRRDIKAVEIKPTGSIVATWDKNALTPEELLCKMTALGYEKGTYEPDGQNFLSLLGAELAATLVTEVILVVGKKYLP